MKLLLTVEIFSSFNLYELCQICDALKLERFNANQIIIQENEEGNKFYIIESGEAKALKTLNDGLIIFIKAMKL